MDIMKKRWLILVASCFVTLCVGSLYAWSVFASPMAQYLTELTGKEIASLAIVFTVANSVGPITMISGGFINDRIGPRWVLVCAGILFGAGMIGSGYIVAVNKDEDAPIFDVADVGIVGNAMDVLPVMIEEIRKLKA